MNIKEYGSVRVQTAICADADDLAPILRPADLQELNALPGVPKDPREALRKAVLESADCFVALDTVAEQPICLFGVNRITPAYGAIWLLGSTGLDKHKWLFLRESKPWLASFERCYSVLGNIVMDSNQLHIDWLRWLGFTFLKHHNGIGNSGEGFYEFCKICATPPSVS